MINKILLMEFFKDDDIKVVDKDFYIKSQMKRDVIKYITILEEENQRLKKLCDKYEEEHNTAFKLWKMKMEEMPTYEEKETLKLKVEKAIEYIKVWQSFSHTNGSTHNELKNLLNILGGDE